MFFSRKCIYSNKKDKICCKATETDGERAINYSIKSDFCPSDFSKMQKSAKLSFFGVNEERKYRAVHFELLGFIFNWMKMDESQMSSRRPWGSNNSFLEKVLLHMFL